jgi:hypothetical protein
MRELTFLLAANGQPMARTWRMVDGELVEKEADRFPAMAKNVSSVNIEIKGIKDFFDCLVEVAAAGGGLLKGSLLRAVQNESRRGLTVKHLPTWWLHLDYDRDDGFDTRDEFLAAIDPALATTSYIFKHSASAGVKSKAGLRGHYFILLTEPVTDSAIRLWLQKINLTVKQFKARIQLSANAMALRYPLDVSTNENSKLHLIAPPQFVGFDDPIETRFELHERASETFRLEPSVTKAAIRKAEHQLLAELQEKAGVDVTTPVYTTVHNVEVISNPKPGAITEVVDCGDFVRCNVNGGDSWAYWYWKDRPDLLYSFKGEPAVKLEDFDAEYHARISQAPREQVVIPFVMRDPVTDTYFNATYDANDRGLLSFYPSKSKERLSDFMQQYGYPRVRVVPDWEVMFNPTGSPLVDLEQRRLNVWAPTEYTHIDIVEGDTYCVPPLIDRAIRHICVDGPTYDHFLNWLAFIFQTRRKSGSAWIFQGIPGTGKGTLFHKAISPLFGARHCHLTSVDILEDKYNGFLRHNLFTWIDEGDIAKASKAEAITRKLKTWIKEPTIELRAMRHDPINVPNYSNFILATNRLVALKLEAKDRRWNVAPRQPLRLEYSNAEYAAIDKELPEFARFLRAYKVDDTRVSEPMVSGARDELIEMSRTISDDFFLALSRGNLSWFADLLRADPPFPDNGYLAFDREVRRWIAEARRDQPIVVEQRVLQQIYYYANPTGREPLTDKKFGWLCRANALEFERRFLNGVRGRFVDIRFRPLSDDELPEEPARTTVLSPRVHAAAASLQ